jgi:TRAP-type C4-dicarboxylate transport system substrate-binding protein
MKLTNTLVPSWKATKSVKAVVLALAVVSVPTVFADTLKISHVRPQGTAIDIDVRNLSKELESATDGDLNLRVYAANALGDYTVVQERISLGAIDMAVQPASSAANRKMQIAFLPYLANNWQEAQNIYGSGGAIREAMQELYAKQDITVLAAYPVYFGGIALNVEDKSAGEIGIKKGIKLRVPPIKSFQLLAGNLGYIAAPLPFSEAFTAVQTGVVDGVIGSGAEGYYASFRDVTKTYIPLNTHFEVWYLIINSERLSDLSDDHQKALMSAATEFENKRWLNAPDEQGKNEQKLADNGANIVEISPQQLAKISEEVRKTVWPEILNDIDPKWAQSILDKIEK